MSESICKNKIKVEEVLLFNRKDLKFVDGNIIIKRKYGKFNREVYKLNRK